MATPGYAARAAKYARDVAAGRVVAGKLTRLACQRHLGDLARWKAKGSPFRFDPKKADHVCKFVELLPHIKGKWAGKRIVLEPWQIFILAVAFGWLRADGLRRFRSVYIEVARKNAKSTLTAAIGLYMLAADGEAGAEILAAATSQDQARIVFSDAQEMARKSSGLQRHYGVKVTAHSVWVAGSASKFFPVSAEANSLEGKNAHLAIIDELHAHKTPAVHNVLEQSMGARTQPMLWRITTAGSNQAGICYQQRGYLIQVLEGVVTDETAFGIMYTIDGPDPATKYAGDDWTDPKMWRKANPNLGVSVFEDDLARLCEKAKRVSSQQADFQTKRLNVWVGAAAPWMNMRAWALCISPEFARLDLLAGRGCYLGVDLAHKIDVAAVARLWVDWVQPAEATLEEALAQGRPAPAPRPLYTAFVRFYLPEGIVEDNRETSHAHFYGWSLNGDVTLTPGNTTDFDMIREDIQRDHADTPVIEGGYDPAQAWSFAPKLRDEDGINMVEVAPTVLNFSEPMKELESAILDGRFRHDGNPVLTWMVSNVTVFRDRKDNIYPRKERDENKIDGVVALLMAFARAMMAIPNVSVYETRDPIVFG